MIPQFDIVVVGAGPAGSSAAIAAARKGASVLLLERGIYPGAKNMVGGMMHGQVLEAIDPDYASQAPFERRVSHQRIMLTSEDASTTIDYANRSFLDAPYNGFTVLRGKFDPWLAQKACDAGAVLVCDTVVDDLVFNGDVVTGVRVRRDEGEVSAKVVVVADGVNSLLATKAGLRSKIEPGTCSLGVKELLALPHDSINERFGLQGDEGAAYACIGDFARGIPGGGFVYTNKDSISIGVVVEPEKLVENGLTADEVLEQFKAKPEIARLIEGGSLIEYSAHLIPEGGYKKMPAPACNGVLLAGDSAGFGVNTGLVLMGMNLAVASGLCAGEVAANAVASGDVSASGMGDAYLSALGNSVALSAMKNHEHAPELIASPRLYGPYTDAVNKLLGKMVQISAGPQEKTMTLAKEVFSEVRIKDLLRDAFIGMRSI